MRIYRYITRKRKINASYFFGSFFCEVETILSSELGENISRYCGLVRNVKWVRWKGKL